MLVVGLQEIDGQTLNIPAKLALRPDRDRLARRYEQFKHAA